MMCLSIAMSSQKGYLKGCLARPPQDLYIAIPRGSIGASQAFKAVLFEPPREALGTQWDYHYTEMDLHGARETL